MDQEPVSRISRSPRLRPIRSIDWIIILCMIVGSGLYLYHASFIRVSRFSDPLGPRAFPYLVGILGLVSAIWLLIESMVRSRAMDQQSSERKTGTPVAFSAVAFVIVWSFLFYAFFEAFDFLVTCTIYSLGLTMFFNRGAWLVNAGFSVLITAALYVTFASLLGVRLPNHIFNINF